MARIAIVFDTREGHTATIAARVAEQLQRDGHEAVVWSVGDLPADFAAADYHGIVVGGPIHFGRHSRALRRFVDRHRQALVARPSAFFSVSLSAAGRSERQQADARRCMDAFLQRTGWSPTRASTFAGALLYRRYGPLTRLVMRWIAGREGGDTDTTRNHEYTDWQQVAAFADDFARVVEAEGHRRSS